jgi:hypothetical protein
MAKVNTQITRASLARPHQVQLAFQKAIAWHEKSGADLGRRFDMIESPPDPPKEEKTMKKSKARTKPAATKKPAKAAKRVAKMARGRATAQKAIAAGEPAERDSLAEAIANLTAITAELREIANDLRDLIGEREETGPDVEAVVITEVENPGGLEGES